MKKIIIMCAFLSLAACGYSQDSIIKGDKGDKGDKKVIRVKMAQVVQSHRLLMVQ